jgi:hypothetical protein
VNWLKKHLYFLPVLLYLPSLWNFFSGDDWFHLRLAQISSLKEFFSFFSFSPTAQSAAFYRPLSTQTFFYAFQQMFGLSAWPYYLFVLLCFIYSLYLVFRFAKNTFKNENKALLASLIYGVSVSNFTRVYFLSAFQEIVLVIFSLLCLLSFPKSKWRSFLYFFLALLSKETAIVLPLLILIFNFPSIRKKFTTFVPFIIFSIVYLYLRFFVFGMAQGDSYVWNFSPAKALNTLSWYTLWSLGTPEFLVDYIGSGFRPIARFYTDFPLWWPVILGLLLSTLILLATLFVKKIKQIDFQFLQYLLLFLIPLVPVIFLPQHKFALELGLPLVGFSLLLVSLLPSKKTLLSILFLVLFAVLNLLMNYLTYTTHYSVNRGLVSRSVYRYLNQNYSTLPEGRSFDFVNDVGDYGSAWGQSKQISQSLSGSDFFKVYYKNQDVKVYYQDMVEEIPSNIKPILIGSKQFLPQ